MLYTLYIVLTTSCLLSHTLGNSLGFENKVLRLKALNTDNYREWKSDEIVFWIASLENGRFKKYEYKIRSVLNEENIDGSCLDELEASDIKTWGIVDFKDRKAMFRHIKSLIEKAKNIKQLHEGNNAPTAYI